MKDTYPSMERAIIILVCALILSIAPSRAWAADGPTADEVLTRLANGNKRFVAGTLTHPHQEPNYRASLAAGQKPFVTILACADSRVSPELLFDLGLGDAFVCRVAGNVVDDDVLGSLEYGVEHLNTPLIVVLGHDKCGAVTAAAAGGSAPGHINALLEKIAPAVTEARKLPGDIVSNAVSLHVQRMVKFISVCEPVFTRRLSDGAVKIIGARYDLATGAVVFISGAGSAEPLTSSSSKTE